MGSPDCHIKLTRGVIRVVIMRRTVLSLSPSFPVSSLILSIPFSFPLQLAKKRRPLFLVINRVIKNQSFLFSVAHMVVIPISVSLILCFLLLLLITHICKPKQKTKFSVRMDCGLSPCFFFVDQRFWCAAVTNYFLLFFKRSGI